MTNIEILTVKKLKSYLKIASKAAYRFEKLGREYQFIKSDIKDLFDDSAIIQDLEKKAA